MDKRSEVWSPNSMHYLHQPQVPHGFHHQQVKMLHFPAIKLLQAFHKRFLGSLCWHEQHPKHPEVKKNCENENVNKCKIVDYSDFWVYYHCNTKLFSIINTRNRVAIALLQIFVLMSILQVYFLCTKHKWQINWKQSQLLTHR